MKYFEKYTSNTTGAAGNQLVFYNTDENEIISSRVFFKITFGGKFNYSFLYSNTVDSTFYDGSISEADTVVDEWYIDSLSVGVCKSCSRKACPADGEFEGEFIPVAFEGSRSKRVAPGEFFATDEISFSVKAGEFICLEMRFHGKAVPCHEETLLPVFKKQDGEWVENTKIPVPSMIGCDRKVKIRIGFIGDSISQGIGTPFNSYEHYADIVSRRLGADYSYWDMALGFARGYDAAKDGAWLFKARQVDVMCVCFGVNDLLQGYSAEEVKKSLTRIVKKLKASGVKVIIQTVPPFDYVDKLVPLWQSVNEYIISELKPLCDGFLDVREFLSESTGRSHMTVYGCHPDSRGNALWGEALSAVLKEVLNN